MSPETEKAMQVFFPYTWERLGELHESGARLVHYCSAATAISIFEKRRVWMRNASMMNDYTEVKYGLDLFFSCWNEEEIRSRIKRVLDAIDKSCFLDLESRVDAIPEFVDNSVYMVCLSEQYDANELNRASVESCGRLSMWRAYGGPTNVSLIMNLSAFFGESGAISAYSSPVCYGDLAKFREEFVRLCKALEENQDYLVQLDPEKVVEHLSNAFIFSVVSFKHPGFSEEREWRVIYLEGWEDNKGVIKSIEKADGTPQIVYQIPLEDAPEQGLVGMTVKDLIHNVLVGPINHSDNVANAIVASLETAGVADAVSRVRRSSIPFRR